MVEKSQADAFVALSLTGFSTKPDAVMLITRRHDISNECKGSDCTAMCCLCVIATKLRAKPTHLSPYFSPVSQPNRMQLCLLLEDMIYPTSVRAVIVLLCVVCAL